MNISRQGETKSFYDEYWPQNVPDYHKTREHVYDIVPNKKYRKVFDGGCGTGVNSLALSEMAEKVVAFDLSSGSLKTAEELANKLEIDNIKFHQGSLLSIPFKNATFDLVYCWGVIHHTVNPVKAYEELARILKPGGYLVLAVYRKTIFSFVHEIIRKFCLAMPESMKGIFIKVVVSCVGLIEKFKKLDVVRDDNPLLESKIEDWYFVPEKHFFSIGEMKRLFEKEGLSFELLYEKTGRFKSTSNFIVRGIKK